MTEANMRKRVVKILKNLDAMPVENVVRPGTPDVAFIGGWLECKKTPSAGRPKNSQKIAILQHGLMNSQRIWLRRHCKKGGRAFVLVQFGSHFCLFDGLWAAEKLGKVSWFETHENCIYFDNWQELEERLEDWLSNWERYVEE